MSVRKPVAGKKFSVAFSSVLSKTGLAECGALLGELRKEKELEGTDGSWQGAELGSDLCGNQVSLTPNVL